MIVASRGEWPLTLDVSALTASGWRPLPFSEFVVKIHSRCDLACDYCYMYELADQTWREQPRRMPEEIAKQTAFRIGEHARAHGMPAVDLILHGGEPLLAGHHLISLLVTATREQAGPDVLVNAKIQTNGVGLNDSYLQLFRDLDIHVGVSLDGAAEAHNRHRRFPSGRGSHAAAVAGLRKLTSAQYRHLFGGLLCTIDLHNEPIATYQSLASLDPPKIDFLLPHGTWTAPPPGRLPEADETPYADWLIEIFDHWYQRPETGIRIFEEIMHLLLGGASSSEIVGLAPTRILVIETNGEIEQGDNLKIAFHGAPYTGLHIDGDPIDAALQLPGVVARQLGSQALPPTCRECRIQKVCGGGLYAHRYRSGNGFYNPSVYCPDLMRLIDHIRASMQDSIDAQRERLSSG
jgi:uncharacterized protein